MGDINVGSTSCGPLPPLAVLVLGLVAERPMHPYEMFQTTIERREDRLAKFRPGTMYHTVDRLAAKELIEIHEVRREGNRPERTVYAITDRGRQALFESLEQILERHPTEYSELYLALAEAHGLPRERVIELLSTRLDAMRADLADLDEAATVVRDRGTPEMFYLDVGCRIATLATQIDWVADLVDRLRTSTIEWLDDPDSPYHGSAVVAGTPLQKANDG
jgi:DNA-binding PadR family transcriptional regulator